MTKREDNDEESLQSAERFAALLRKHVAVIAVPQFSGPKQQDHLSKLFSGSGYSKLDISQNPAQGTLRMDWQTGALSASNRSTYIADIQLADQDEHTAIVEQLIASTNLPLWVAGVVRGGLLGATRYWLPKSPNERIWRSTAGVFSFSGYFFGSAPVNKDHLQQDEDTPIALTSFHGEAGDLPALNVRVKLPGTEDSTRPAIWVFPRRNRKNIELFGAIYAEVQRTIVSHYSKEGQVQLPLATYTKRGVQFEVCAQHQHDMVLVGPEWHHAVYTPPGVAKLATNFALPSSLEDLSRWRRMWERQMWHLPDGITVHCCYHPSCTPHGLMSTSPCSVSRASCLL